MYRLACPGLLLAATAAAQWTALDYEPTVREVVLDTDFTRIVPRNAPPFDVTGGVFMFRNVRISQGVTVRATGSRPMIWIVSGDFVVDGVLSVRGIDGESVMTLNSAHIPALSGPGGPAAGNGGQGSPSRTGQDPLGEPGFGPFQVPGGGGGGGALAILALGRIIVGATGRIVADGGNGGGGEAAGGNTHGAGGGGGSGGMLLLYAQNEIQLQVHGETYANRDYDFVLSADGGIGTQGRYGGPEFLAKYPPPSAGAIWDWNPSGGFGGLGLVQLFARPGANADGTNTHLDDNVRLFHGTTELVGREKQRYLAWRGFPNAQNVLVDDFGQPTHVGDNEGDIRPTPILLPILP